MRFIKAGRQAQDSITGMLHQFRPPMLELAVKHLVSGMHRLAVYQHLKSGSRRYSR
jgi:hypothetical protein